MGVYEKMKAVIYDLSETMDEAISFKSYAGDMKPALAGVCYASANESHGINSIGAEQAAKYGNASRYSQLQLS